MACALCQRTVDNLTEHHLKPRSRRKKRETTSRIWICGPCHRQIHVLFSNVELAQIYNTGGRLRDEPRMALFLKWVARQDPNKAVRVRR